MATVSPTLELVVRQALEAQVRELVDGMLEEVAADVIRERLNGGGTMVPSEPVSSMEETMSPMGGTATKTCRVCNETKAASSFERGRKVCVSCRRAAERERARHRAPGGAHSETNGKAEVTAVPLEQP